MFIDDKAKLNYCTSDTIYNVVYEGNLRELTHKVIKQENEVLQRKINSIVEDFFYCVMVV